MNRRDLLSRVGLVAVAGASALAGRLTADVPGGVGAASGSDDEAEDDCEPTDAERDGDGASEANEEDCDLETYGIDADDLEAYGIDDPADVEECAALGDVDDDAESPVVIVRNDADDEREIDLAVALADGSDDVERTLELPAGRAAVVVIGEREGFDVAVDADGSTARTSVGRFRGGTSRTTITVDDGGVRVKTVSRS